MGLDLYAGPLTRYVTSAWQTIIEQAAAAEGGQAHVVHVNDPDAVGDPAQALPVVQEWQRELQQAFGLASTWRESVDGGYTTDKPDWSGYTALLLAAAQVERPDLPRGTHGPDPRLLGASEAFVAASAQPRRYPSLLLAEWWLPIALPSPVFEAPAPNGVTMRMGTVEALVAELDDLAAALRLGTDALGTALLSGPPLDLDFEGTATFGCAVFTDAARWAQQHQQPLVLDY